MPYDEIGSGRALEVHALEDCFLEEITRQRFMMYIEELKWAGKLMEMRDGRIRLRDDVRS